MKKQGKVKIRKNRVKKKIKKCYNAMKCEVKF